MASCKTQKVEVLPSKAKRKRWPPTYRHRRVTIILNRLLRAKKLSSVNWTQVIEFKVLSFLGSCFMWPCIANSLNIAIVTNCGLVKRY